MNEIAVSRMHFDHVEARRKSAFRRISKGADNRRNVGGRQCPRDRIVIGERL